MHRTHTTSTERREVPHDERAPYHAERAPRENHVPFHAEHAARGGHVPHHAERAQKAATSAKAHRATRSTGSVTRMRTPRRRSEDARVNLRRSYQALVRKLRAGDSASSTYQTWPVRPYAASL